MPESKPHDAPPARWARLLTGRPAHLLLSGDAERLARQPGHRFTHAWIGVMVLSLGWGAVWVGLWGGTWRLTAQPGLLLVSAAVVLGAMFLGPYRRAATALGELVAGPGVQHGTACAALVAGVALCLLGLHTNLYHHENVLPAALAWSRPAAEAQRVLLLMPVWGAWGMLMAVQFVRPGVATSAAVCAFARGCGPLAAVGALGLPGGLTWLYFHFLGGLELAMIAAAVVAAVASGPLLARVAGGLTSRSLRAGNLATQIVFLLAYLAVR